MKQNKTLVIFSFALLAFGFKSSTGTDHEWESLFNGKDLTGWDTWLGAPLDDAGKQITTIPVGLNNDPKRVFTVVNDQGDNVIRISGEAWGGISTLKEYENFHFQLKFKWGSLTWASKKNKKKDSGLLYHAVGDHGADYGAWMRSQEFQIEETNSGDYWGVAGGIEDIRATKKSDSEYVYNPNGELYTFKDKSKVGRHCIKRSDAEKPSGEWNLLDLYCHGDTSVHVINGVPMMVLIHSRQLQDGKEVPLTKGKLQIQSEGAEVFYKDLQIRKLESIPPELMK